MKLSRTFPGKFVYLLPVIDPQGADRRAVPDPRAEGGAEVFYVDFLTRPHIAGVGKKYDAEPLTGVHSKFEIQHRHARSALRDQIAVRVQGTRAYRVLPKAPNSSAAADIEPLMEWHIEGVAERPSHSSPRGKC